MAMKIIHQQTVEDALSSLHTSADGLNCMEAGRRLSEYGPTASSRNAVGPSFSACCALIQNC